MFDVKQNAKKQLFDVEIVSETWLMQNDTKTPDPFPLRLTGSCGLAVNDFSCKLSHCQSVFEQLGEN